MHALRRMWLETELVLSTAEIWCNGKCYYEKYKYILPCLYHLLLLSLSSNKQLGSFYALLRVDPNAAPWNECCPITSPIHKQAEEQAAPVTISLWSSSHTFPDRPQVLPLGWETGLCVCVARLDSADCLRRSSAEIHERASLSPASWYLQPVGKKKD